MGINFLSVEDRYAMETHIILNIRISLQGKIDYFCLKEKISKSVT